MRFLVIICSIPFQFTLYGVVVSFVLMFCFHQVHSERPTPQMRAERRAMILLRRVVEACQEGGGGDDWRFCLLAASILSDVAMNNITRGTSDSIITCLITLGTV